VKSNSIKSWNEDAPKVIAHRGASFLAPENTMTAFGLARELGADGIELDVKLSKDRIPVVLHDMTLERTTDGAGRVKDWTYNDLKELDAGYSFSEVFKGECIPTLDQVLDAFGDTILMNIELTNYDAPMDDLAVVVGEHLEGVGLNDTILISSFNPFVLRAMRRIAGHFRIGLLLSPGLPKLARWMIMRLVDFDDLHPHHTEVDLFVERPAKNRSGYLNVWTANRFDEIKDLLMRGVGGVITDDVETAKRAREVAIG
jgi:glycerophosphoryl diester phosphodiesterase